MTGDVLSHRFGDQVIVRDGIELQGWGTQIDLKRFTQRKPTASESAGGFVAATKPLISPMPKPLKVISTGGLSKFDPAVLRVKIEIDFTQSWCDPALIQDAD